ncbi:hypothetical protein BGX38DRAFT_1233313 [Terfezia claveryi]|nr:hypothetical protein BGX38DRAFT_1233313 [Terfezia claveryi]
MTPRRGAPVLSTSSVLRDIDNMRSSRVWEFCCDKQQQPYLSSDGAAANHHRHHHHHHHHHSALEPDEAGMALSIARSRRRIEASKDARRKLVFNVALTRDDGELGAMIDGPGVQRRGLVYDDDGPFGNGKKPEAEVTKATLPGKKRISLGEVGSNCSAAKLSTSPSTSTCRRREIEVYEQLSSSQTTVPLQRSSQRYVLPTPVPGGKRQQLFSSPRGGTAGAGSGGGEDYYIFGHESDKENYRDDGEKAAISEDVDPKQQRPLKALKKSLATKDRGWRGGEKAPPPSGVMKKSRAKINVVGGDGTGTGSGGGGDEKRMKKKRKVLGDAAAVQRQVQKPGEIVMIGKERAEQGREAREVDIDLGGAELLLSLSVGRWGC